MNGALLVVLALLWAVMLLPGAIRSRRSSLRATVGGFNRAMESLRNEPTPGRTVMVPGDAGRAASGSNGAGTGRSSRAGGAVSPAVLARRRRILLLLVVTTLAVTVLAVVAGGSSWLLMGVSVLALGVYVALLRRWKLERDNARRVVRDLTALRDVGHTGSDAYHDRYVREPEPSQNGRRRVAGAGVVMDFDAARRPAGRGRNVRVRQPQAVR